MMFLAAALIATPAAAEQSLFARLVDATERGDKDALVRILSSRPLSTSRGTVGADNYLMPGKIRYDVPAAELADKLRGCAVVRWSDVPNVWGNGFVLWHCRAERVPENPCWFYTYRAAMFDPGDRPVTLFIGAMPTRDVAVCGAIVPPPPRWPGIDR